MNRYLVTLAALVLAGCGAGEATLSDSQANTEQGVDKSSPSSALAVPVPPPTKMEEFYGVRRDARRCPSPMCGGWFLRTLNLAQPERYVSEFDFAPSGLGTKEINSVQQAAEATIILKGAIAPGMGGTEQLLITEAYLGLPGVTAAVDLIYSVKDLPLDCVNCPTLRAALLNTSKVESAYTLSVKAAALPLVQVDYLHNRVLWHNALVAASVTSATSLTSASDAVSPTIDASQVFIKLPDLAGPCPPAPANILPTCTGGLVEVFTRDANRCLISAGCVKPGPCPLYRPYCSGGYRFVSWPVAPNACDAFACDPEFVAP